MIASNLRVDVVCSQNELLDILISHGLRRYLINRVDGKRILCPRLPTSYNTLETSTFEDLEDSIVRLGDLMTEARF